MPFLSMVRSAAVETRSFTQRFSLATQNRRSCRFGMKRRRVLFIACDTLLPVVVRLPVTWQTRDIAHLEVFMVPPLAREAAAPTNAGLAAGACHAMRVRIAAWGRRDRVPGRSGARDTGGPDTASRQLCPSAGLWTSPGPVRRQPSLRPPPSGTAFPRQPHTLVGARLVAKTLRAQARSHSSRGRRLS